MAAKILLVDDEPAQLELLRYNLEKAGFETIQAENGRDAILLTEEHEPDLVVLDWMMPEASGIDVCRELRARRNAPATHFDGERARRRRRPLAWAGFGSR